MRQVRVHWENSNAPMESFLAGYEFARDNPEIRLDSCHFRTDKLGGTALFVDKGESEEDYQLEDGEGDGYELVELDPEE